MTSLRAVLKESVSALLENQQMSFLVLLKVTLTKQHGIKRLNEKMGTGEGRNIPSAWQCLIKTDLLLFPLIVVIF